MKRVIAKTVLCAFVTVGVILFVAGMMASAGETPQWQGWLLWGGVIVVVISVIYFIAEWLEFDAERSKQSTDNVRPFTGRRAS